MEPRTSKLLTLRVIMTLYNLVTEGHIWLQLVTSGHRWSHLPLLWSRTSTMKTLMVILLLKLNFSKMEEKEKEKKKKDDL